MNTTINNTHTSLKAELRIINKAAWVILAVALLLWFGLGLPAMIHTLPPHEQAGTEGVLLSVIGVFMGIIISVWILLTFYVNADAGRRHMSRLMWTLLVIFVPYAIGFIVYYVVRRPIPQLCPNCGGVIQADFLFCPACRHELKTRCPECQRHVETGWVNCAFCGRKLA
ncbi:MAG: zinc ribbon domain-containing protein [Acidobacteriia bacterium]|nr:zinc ribbon domain-containing protein [Terriglobia bacterium]